MTLFTDHEADLSPRRRRIRAGWLFITLGMVFAVILAMVPSPYVIEKPGPAFNTLGTSEVDNAEVPLISIPVEETYPTTGSLDMLTVSVVGSPQGLPNWVDVVTAWLDPSKAVVPVESVYPTSVTTTEVNERNRIEMENSQQNAIAAALTALGHSFTSTLTIAGFTDPSPSEGILMAGDEILSVNGQTFRDVDSLRAAIKRNGVDRPAQVSVRRGGVTRVVQVTPVMSGHGADAAPVLGIVVGTEYDFPFQVKIQLTNVGGPSAGMMFALGIIDKLTPGALTGGKRIAGTGTITADGIVGPIGGIRQKMYGAKDAGATYFIAPASNCSQVNGHIPDGLKVFSVKTLTDSLAVVNGIASGNTAKLPTCSAP